MRRPIRPDRTPSSTPDPFYDFAEMMHRHALTTTESSQLLPVLASSIAQASGARSLLLKGKSANHHGMRPLHHSADVDLLVEPRAFDTCLDGFIASGWEPLSPRVFRLNLGRGTTLRHTLWPNPIDFHRHFPGFTSPDDQVFERLWAAHTTIELAGRPVPTVDAAGACVIQALHAIRDAAGDPRDELTAAAMWFVAAPDDVRAQVVQLATDTGAVRTLVPFWDRTGVAMPPVPPPTDIQRTKARDFERLINSQNHRPASYLALLVKQPAWRWPVEAVRFAFGSYESLRVWYPDLPNSRSSLWRARWWRVRDSIRQSPEAIRHLR